MGNSARPLHAAGSFEGGAMAEDGGCGFALAFEGAFAEFGVVGGGGGA